MKPMADGPSLRAFLTQPQPDCRSQPFLNQVQDQAQDTAAPRIPGRGHLFAPVLSFDKLRTLPEGYHSFSGGTTRQGFTRG